MHAHFIFALGTSTNGMSDQSIHELLQQADCSPFEHGLWHGSIFGPELSPILRKFIAKIDTLASQSIIAQDAFIDVMIDSEDLDGLVVKMVGVEIIEMSELCRIDCKLAFSIENTGHTID